MGCAFILVVLLWFIFGMSGMWYTFHVLAGVPEWATILLVMVLIAITWLIGDDT